MGIRDYGGRHNTRRVKTTIESPGEIQYNSNEEKTIRIRLIYPSKVKLIGSVSGKPYMWDGAGSELDVDERDVNVFLEQYIGGRPCCGVGNPNGNKLFELV